MFKSNYINQSVKSKEMEGYLDYFVLAPSLDQFNLMHSRKYEWITIYAVCDESTGLFKIFSLGEGKSRGDIIKTLDIRHCTVAAAEDGEEFLNMSSKKTECNPQNSLTTMRRYVFVVTEVTGLKTTFNHHFCINAFDDRLNLEIWINTIQSIKRQYYVNVCEEPLSIRELHNKMESYLDRLQIIAEVAEEAVNKREYFYMINVKAWMLTRDQMLNTNKLGQQCTSLLIENAFDWEITKSASELQNFDKNIKLLLSEELREIHAPILPSSFCRYFSVFYQAGRDTRVAAWNAYLQRIVNNSRVLRFNNVGSSILDTFLEVSAHTSHIKLLNTALYSKEKRFLPSLERKQFEKSLNLYVQNASGDLCESLRNSPNAIENQCTWISGHIFSSCTHDIQKGKLRQLDYCLSRDPTHDRNSSETFSMDYSENTFHIDTDCLDEQAFNAYHIQHRMARLGHKVLPDEAVDLVHTFTPNK